MLRANTQLADWARETLVDAKGNSLSYQQAAVRTGVDKTVFGKILQGQNVSAETIIKIALAFGRDVGEALRLAGKDDMAELWQSRAAHAPAENLAPEEVETLGYLRGMPNADRQAAKSYIQYLATKHATTDPRDQED